MFDGDITNASYTPEKLSDPRILAFMSKIKVAEDPALTARTGASVPARIGGPASNGYRWPSPDRRDDAASERRREARGGQHVALGDAAFQDQRQRQVVQAGAVVFRRRAVVELRAGEGPLAVEQLQDGLRTLVGDGERLHAQLLLDLECLQVRAFLAEVGVHEVADALLQDVHQLAGELGLDVDALGARAERGKGVGHVDDRLADRRQCRRGHCRVAQRRRMDRKRRCVDVL